MPCALARLKEVPQENARKTKINASNDSGAALAGCLLCLGGMFAATVSGSPFVYRRRQPEKTVLCQAVAEHLPRFVAMSEETEWPVRTYVRREFEGFLD